VLVCLELLDLLASHTQFPLREELPKPAKVG
jgi:hypothetical protein